MHEYIDVSNSSQRFYIDKQNPIFTKQGFAVKDKQFTISFLKEEAKHLNNNPNYWYFEKINHDFSLVSLPVPNPNPVPLKVKWRNSLEIGYHFFETFSGSPKTFHISVNHPVFQGKELEENRLNFDFNFVEGNESKKNSHDEPCFDANNDKFTLTPLAPWPAEEPRLKITIEYLKGRNSSAGYCHTFFREEDKNKRVLIDERNLMFQGLNPKPAKVRNLLFLITEID